MVSQLARTLYKEALGQKKKEEKLYQKGRKEGRQEGLQEGRHEGRQEGFQEGLRKAMLLLRSNGQTISQIAVAMSMSEEEVRTLVGEE